MKNRRSNDENIEVRSLGYYNGFGPKQRDGALKAIRAAIAEGNLSQPTFCSVCGRQPEKPLGWHSEDYRRPLSAFPICKRCHYALHIRFRRPAYWRTYINALDPAGWFQYLSVDPRSLFQPFDETYPNGLPDRNMAASSETGGIADEDASDVPKGTGMA